MRFIEKGPEPREFIEWKACATEDWKPTYDMLGNPEKAIVKKALIRDQKGICCYCERKLVESDSHIEHIVPQSTEAGKNLSVDYNNLLCSCMNAMETGQPLHCGKLRGDWYGPDYLSPLSRDCENRFAYSFDGAIKAKNERDDQAKATIRKLGLDKEILKDRRKKALSPFFDPTVELTAEEIKKLAKAFSEPRNNGFYDPGFPSMFFYLFLSEHEAD